MVQSSKGNIILDSHIKTHVGWEAKGHERAQLANALTNKDVKDLHAKVAHPPEVITHATTKAKGIHLTDMFRLCEDCTLDKPKKG